MKLSSQAGFTLIELIVAAVLSVIVLLGLSSILTPLVLSQVYAARAQGAQVNLAAVEGLIERELRQASLVNQPPGTGAASAVLEGCDNAAPSPVAPPAAIDPSAPMKWFAFCASGGSLYYHTGPGCPAAYLCGAAPTASFPWPLPPSPLSFTRSPGDTLVTAVIAIESASGPVLTSTTAVAFSAPAGGAQ